MSDDPKEEEDFDDESSEEEESDEEEDAPAKKEEEDEFEFGNDPPAAGAAGESPAVAVVSQAVHNQHFDEALSVSEDEESIDDSVSMDQSIDQVRAEPPVAAAAAAPANAGSSDDDDDDDSDDSDDEGDDSDEKPAESAAADTGSYYNAAEGATAGQKQDDDDDDDESSSGSESDEGDDGVRGDGAKMYNAQDYAHLKVSAEIQDLFDYIERYKASDIELETFLKPFIPDFIPAVGEIDPFIKIPPPDGTKDNLGLILLDEPSAQQSDPTVLDIKIRVMSKHTGLAPVQVRSIENADKNPKRITTWINNIEEVHRKKPPPAVNYSKNMPDIEELMQVWPSEFEELLKEIPLPSAELDMDLAQYAKIVCALLDIPVYDKLTESLHVLFTLYNEFKNNSHFQQ